MGVAGHLGAGRGPDAVSAEIDIICPVPPDGARFALLAPGDGRAEAVLACRKPFAAERISGLARHILNARGADALQLAPERVRWLGRTFEAVRVVAEDQVGGRARLIGHAWIGGRDWRALAHALESVQPSHDLGGARDGGRQ